MNWRFINTGHRRGKFNMEYDEFLASRLIEGVGFPTVRVYGWNPPSISLGYNQREDDIDLKLCENEGIDIVRRPTGGRAILHWNELTYSVVMNADEMSVAAIYEKISRALVAGIRSLGIDVELEKSQPNFQSLYKDAASIPCFSSSARYEIQYHGRKLVGSAQRRYSQAGGKEVVLQHGSILLGPEHKWLMDFLSEKNPEIITVIKNTIEEKTTDINTILGKEVPFDKIAASIKKGFEEEWNIMFVPDIYNSKLEFETERYNSSEV
jgi:lipoate-protein ligase A